MDLEFESRVYQTFRFHWSCTSVPKDPAQFLPFMVNYKYTCSGCSGTETFELRLCRCVRACVCSMHVCPMHLRAVCPGRSVCGGVWGMRRLRLPPKPRRRSPSLTAAKPDRRTPASSWIESVLGAMANLMWTTQRDMFKVSEIGDHLEKHWDVVSRL